MKNQTITKKQYGKFDDKEPAINIIDQIQSVMQTLGLMNLVTLLNFIIYPQKFHV